MHVKGDAVVGLEVGLHVIVGQVVKGLMVVGIRVVGAPVVGPWLVGLSVVAVGENVVVGDMLGDAVLGLCV